MEESWLKSSYFHGCEEGWVDDIAGFGRLFHDVRKIQPRMMWTDLYT